MGLLGNPRQSAARGRLRGAGAGLHPVDGRGQYVSPKATSKRNRREVR